MIKLSIIAKDKISYEGEAEAVFVPTTTGLIEVLPMHVQIISTLSKGDIIVKNAGNDQRFPISGGVLEVRKGDNIIILVS